MHKCNFCNKATFRTIDKWLILFIETVHGRSRDKASSMYYLMILFMTVITFLKWTCLIPCSVGREFNFKSKGLKFDPRSGHFLPDNICLSSPSVTKEICGEIGFTLLDN